MLIELANHNDDIRRLIDKGYALRVDGAYLVVRDIPYLDDQKALKWGAIVTVLEFIDKVRIKQQDHQIYFAGSAPHDLDGQPIRNLGGGAATVSLNKTDVVVERSFSNKPRTADGQLTGYDDFFDKIDRYVNIISGPAIALFSVSPFTFRVDAEAAAGSVFKFRDTLTARSEINDLAVLFKDEIVAVIGLGGTGSYLVDFLVKMPLKEIRAFDGNSYHVHNAFRSPGRLEEIELGTSKAEVFEHRYNNFREAVHFHPKYLDNSCGEDLKPAFAG